MPVPEQPPADRVEVWADGDHRLGEGARRVDGRLVFVDILAGRLL